MYLLSFSPVVLSLYMTLLPSNKVLQNRQSLCKRQPGRPHVEGLRDRQTRGLARPGPLLLKLGATLGKHQSAGFDHWNPGNHRLAYTGEWGTKRP
jgi:hypothetical protein